MAEIPLPSQEQRLLITGSNGKIGRLLVARLARPGRKLRLIDLVRDSSAIPDGAEFLQGSVTDEALLERAVQDVDAIVHLAGIPSEASWTDILETNVHGTWAILNAARRAAIRKVVLASSNHAVGSLRRSSASAEIEGAVESLITPTGTVTTPVHTQVPLLASNEAAPDSYYGFSKTAMESLGRLFVAKSRNLSVVAIRVGSCREEPRDIRGLAVWLSLDDLERLVEAALSSKVVGYHCVWGISRNTRRWWSLAEGEAIGYHPVDDAEIYAHRFVDMDKPSDQDGSLDYVGGPIMSWELGQKGVKMAN